MGGVVRRAGSADLSLLLFAIWDPIGVSDVAIAAGENTTTNVS